jgi:hypothetical protein
MSSTTKLMLVVSLGILAAVLSCTRHAPEATAKRSSAQMGQPRLLRPGDLTPQERKWGIAPTRSSEVTYQPDVLIVENGSDAIRGVSNDGLTWRVDAASVPASEIRRGRVIFLTSRAVGRVLDVHREGQNLALLLGPVELTDVVRDCNVSLDQTANFGDAITYTLPDMPGRAVELPPIAANDDGRRQWLRPVQTGRVEPYLTDTISQLGTLGAHVQANKGGVQLSGDVAFHLLNPKVYFHLIISKGEVMVAELQLQGAVGFNVAFAAVSKDDGPHSFNGHAQVPADISIPVGGPFPITVTVRQQFIVSAGFGAPGTLQAQGDYEFGGAVSLRYSKPAFDIGRPKHFNGEETLLNSVAGVSLVPSFVSITHQVKVIGGFGAYNFVVGPYVYLNTNANVTRHGDTDILAGCNFAGFTMLVGTGVGYVLPQPVVSVINAILEALNIGKIRGEGGFEGPRANALNAVHAVPEKPICMNAIAGGTAPPPPKSAKAD